jgi:uncharacterized protein YndB with AHSA1/START domain
MSSSEGSSGLIRKAIWDFSVILNVTIGRPPMDVWSFFLGEKKNVWTMSEYTTIEGEVGEVGEVYTHAHRVHGFQVLYEAINVNPERHLVLKITIRESTEEKGHLMGYDFITLKEVAGGTVVGFQQATALPVEKTVEELHALTLQHNERIVGLFQNLKKVVEASVERRIEKNER